MAKFTLFLDRRVWSNTKLIIEADNLEDAWDSYKNGMLTDQLEKVVWHDDDVEITLVDVEDEKGSELASRAGSTANFR